MDVHFVKVKTLYLKKFPFERNLLLLFWSFNHPDFKNVIFKIVYRDVVRPKSLGWPNPDDKSIGVAGRRKAFKTGGAIANG